MCISFAYEPRDVDGYIADYILVACIQNISARCIERIMASETCGSSYIGGSIFFGDSAFEPRIVGEKKLHQYKKSDISFWPSETVPYVKAVTCCTSPHFDWEVFLFTTFFSYVQCKL